MINNNPVRFELDLPHRFVEAPSLCERITLASTLGLSLIATGVVEITVRGVLIPVTVVTTGAIVVQNAVRNLFNR